MSTARTALVLALAGTLGCREAIGDSDFRVEAPGTPPAPLEGRSEECRRCAAEQCASELSSCDTECAAHAACLASGPGPARRAVCTLQHPDGSLHETALNRCVGSRCQQECVTADRWACLSDATRMPDSVDDSIEVRVQYWNVLLNAEPLPDLEIRVCQALAWSDPGCVVGELARGRTNESGNVAIEVPLPDSEPLDAYLDVSGADYLPELRYHSTPAVHDVAVAQSGITEQAYELFSAGLRTEQVPGHGLLNVTVLDCNQWPAPDVALELSPTGDATRRFYSRGKLNFSAELDATQADGIALFTNVPAGRVRLRASSGGLVVNELELPIYERTRTAVYLEPSFVR